MIQRRIADNSIMEPTVLENGTRLPAPVMKNTMNLAGRTLPIEDVAILFSQPGGAEAIARLYSAVEIANRAGDRNAEAVRGATFQVADLRDIRLLSKDHPRPQPGSLDTQPVQ